MRSFQTQWTGIALNALLVQMFRDCSEEERGNDFVGRKRKRPGGGTAQGRQLHYSTRSDAGGSGQLASLLARYRLSSPATRLEIEVWRWTSESEGTSTNGIN
jgi:hypothetical protein